MRVCIVNHYAKPPRQVGGTRHFMLGRELVRLGHEVDIVACDFNHATRKRVGQSHPAEVVDGVRFHWIPAPAYRDNGLDRFINMAVFAGRTWAGKFGRPDVLLGSTPDLLAAFAAQRLAARARVPFILEVRDIWPQTWIDLGIYPSNHPLVRAAALIEGFLYRQASCLITPYPFAVDHFKAAGVEEARVVWIPHGVNTSQSPFVMLPENRVFTVGYVGSHATANALDSVLDADRLLVEKGWASRVRLCFVGDGPLKSRLRDRAAREGLVNVEFRDPVPYSDVHKLLSSFDGLILAMRATSLYRYGFSFNKLADYLAAGRPVVFSSSARNDPIGDARAGITVAAEDPDAMAEAIRRLVELPLEQRELMAANGRRYAEQHYDVVEHARHLAAAMERAVREQGGHQVPRRPRRDVGN
jgi:glycosyltransferase involved in cell wall biosynthesis